MKKGVFAVISLFFLLVIGIAFSQDNEDAKVDNEVEDLLNQQDEVSVIVVLEDDESALDGYSASELNAMGDFEKEKMMIGEQQERVLSGLNEGHIIPASIAGPELQNNQNMDFELKQKFTSMNGFAGNLTREGLDKLKQDNNVKKIYFDYPVKVDLSTSGPLINATYANRVVANDTNITGKHETICIVDSGVEYTHSNLGGCSQTDNINDGSCPTIIGGYDFVNKDSNPIDDNGHGTFMAGIIISNHPVYRGIAPDAKLVAIKSLGIDGTGLSSDVAAGIDWCKTNASLFNISVISLSLGLLVDGSEFTSATSCDGNDITVDAANQAAASGIFVVAASGNSGDTNGITSPACGSNVTGVGGANSDDSSLIFNRGPNLNLIAPAVSITSTYRGNTLASASGTSMATPHVAAAGALLHQFKKLENGTELTPTEIENALNRTGKQITDSASGLTFSRINIFKSMFYLYIGPQITFVSPTPANKSNIANSSFFINATSNKNLLTALLEFNGTNETMDGLDKNWYKNKTGLDSGVYFYKVWGNDSVGKSNVSELRVIQINNTKPEIIEFFPNITEVEVIEPDNQTFNITINNSDADILTILWFRNGTLISNSEEFNFTGNFSAFGFYNITVEITDGFLNDSKQWNFTVNNTNRAPSAANITINSTDFLNRTNGTLAANWSFSDLDNDIFNTQTTSETFWYNNNIEYEPARNSISLSHQNTTKGESWTFSVRVSDGMSWSDFVNATIDIRNAKPVLNINTTAIELFEVQAVNISFSGSDIDNDNLNYTINSSSFARESSYFFWTTNITDAGNYNFNVTLNDSESTDSIIINVSISDAADADNDGNPDFNDTDDDNDGVVDSSDNLIGNLSSVNTTAKNLSIIIGGSTNLARVFNGSSTINFTQNNLTIISFDFNFSKGTDNASSTIMEGNSKPLSVNGKNYLVTVLFVDSAQTRLTVNSETTSLLGENQTYALNDGAIVGVLDILYQDFAGGVHSTAVYISSETARTLDLTGITANQTTNGSSAVSIRGIDLTSIGKTKTIFLEKINTTVAAVCIKDADAGFDTISSACNAANEVLINCDNQTSNGYTCYDTGLRYKITGLNHSAVKELCVDNDGDGYGRGCSLGTDCDDNAFSSANACSSGSSSSSGSGGGGGGSSGGGGGGGGSGLSYTCSMDWQCGEWSACDGAWETRKCGFVKVPQHTQKEECPSISKTPEMAKKCKIKAQAFGEKQAEVPEEGKANEAKGANETKAAQITGMAVREPRAKPTNITRGAIIALIAVSALIVYVAVRARRQ